MKNAKVLLASVVIFGILGGAMSFKAARHGVKTYYTTTVANAVPPCTNRVDFAIITTTTAAPLRYWTTICGASAVNYNRVVSNVQ